MFYEFEQLSKLIEQSASRLEILERQELATGREAHYREAAEVHFKQAEKSLRHGNGQLPMAMAGYYLMLAENERGTTQDG